MMFITTRNTMFQSALFVGLLYVISCFTVVHSSVEASLERSTLRGSAVEGETVSKTEVTEDADTTLVAVTVSGTTDETAKEEECPFHKDDLSDKFRQLSVMTGKTGTDSVEEVTYPLVGKLAEETSIATQTDTATAGDDTESDNAGTGRAVDAETNTGRLATTDQDIVVEKDHSASSLSTQSEVSGPIEIPQPPASLDETYSPNSRGFERDNPEYSFPSQLPDQPMMEVQRVYITANPTRSEIEKVEKQNQKLDAAGDDGRMYFTSALAKSLGTDDGLTRTALPITVELRTPRALPVGTIVDIQSDNDEVVYITRTPPVAYLGSSESKFGSLTVALAATFGFLGGAVVSQVVSHATS